MLKITALRAFSDNYIWLLQREGRSEVVVVDPGQSEMVIEHLDKHELKLVAILITHQHYDHTGGVQALLALYPDIPVIGPDRDCSEVKLDIDLLIPEFITYAVAEGDMVFLPQLGLNFDVISTPGHTLDHLAFVGEGIAFCGDTLFGAGCGRIFSGTAQMFSASLSKLAALPADTRLYCAHEYTVDNLGFAKRAEPNNHSIIERGEAALKKQQEGQPTIPTTVALELATNPFMRLQQPEVKQAAENYAGKTLDEDWQVFAALREWKDTKYD
ncbi:Hydroxyacylglutathione hydrolase [hydrothermal vent metagenome]|uniref:hydroxyacylglutathione hydrolase n=1 Tax=hydrothermal vent metagenome TaxID=652676 RepID=A0A3B0XS62_9ZZZZ